MVEFEATDLFPLNSQSCYLVLPVQMYCTRDVRVEDVALLVSNHQVQPQQPVWRRKENKYEEQMPTGMAEP